MYELKIGEGIGQIRLGMNRSEVLTVFNDLTEQREIPYGYDREIVSDCNADFMIYYDAEDRVEFILCISPEKVEYCGRALSDHTIWGLYVKLKEEDAAIDADGEGFVSNHLGFGISIETCYDENERAYDLIQSVQVAVKNYWNSEQ